MRLLHPVALLFFSVMLVAAQSGSPVTLPARPANGRQVQQPPQPSSFDCSADGTVVNAITNEPIPRAHVNLMAAGTSYAAITDAGGRWTLQNLGCAAANLQVSRAGFLQAFMNPPQLVMQPIRLVSGSPVHDLRTPLIPQSVAIGKVVDDQGDPVQRVQVTALAARVSPDGKARFQQAGTAASNDIGEFRIAALQPGKYIFCTHMNERPNGTNGQLVATDSCYPGPLDAGSASAMDLPAGREVTVDFTMKEVPAIHIRGTLTGVPEGRNVGINLVEVIPNADLNRSVSAPARDEKFDFHVAPGSYILSADYFEGGKHLTARVPVNAGNVDVDNVVVHVDEGFTVNGVIHFDAKSATPPQQFGLGLRSLEQMNGGNGQVRWGADHTTFTISDLVAGNFRLNVNPPPPFYVRSATLAGQDILNNWIPMSQAAGPIEIVLADDGGSLEGDVVDSSGQPAAGGILLLKGSSRIGIAYADREGHFKIQNLPPGDYTAYAWDDVSRVQYAEPDWMRHYGSGGVAVSIAAAQNTQTKLTLESVPPI